MTELTNWPGQFVNWSRRELLAGMAALPFLKPFDSGLTALAQDREWRACVIGHTGRGNYGHGMDTCFDGFPNIKVAGLADPSEKGREARKGKAERLYADWREMLAQEKPNLVSIGPRWVENRVEMFAACAEIGAHVYSEKPMALSLADADAILAACDKAGVKTQFAHQNRPLASLLFAKKRVDEGLIGDILELRARGKEDHRAGGEDMAVLGWHCMYLMRCFAGDPLWAQARVQQNGKDITRDDRRQASEPLGWIAGDTIHASFAFANGVMGHFASQKQERGPGNRFGVTIYGSKGAISLGPGSPGKILYTPDRLWHGAWQPLPDCPADEGPAVANRKLVEDLLSAAEPMASGREARWSLEMIHGVYASHLAGARVSLPLKDRKHPLEA
jgi:predicted dehydrogenase